MSREAIYSALFAMLETLKSSGKVKICDRKLRLLDETATAELPAIMLGVGDQDVKRTSGMPAARTFEAKIYLYVGNPDPKVPAGIQLNNLLDEIEQLLEPPPGFDLQSLGGLVHDAHIHGRIQVFEGPLGQKGAAIITVRIIVP